MWNYYLSDNKTYYSILTVNMINPCTFKFQIGADAQKTGASGVK